MRTLHPDLDEQIKACLDAGGTEMDAEGFQFTSSIELGQLISILPYTLTTLNLVHCGIGRRGAEFLAKSTNLKSLTTLDLSDNNISRTGAEYLAKSTTLKNLTTLNLADSGIGCTGVELLAKSNTLKNLTTLNLSSNGISDTGVEHLAKSTTLKNLTTLDLSGNNIGRRGAEFLAKSTNLKSLTTLDLSDNNISRTGAEYLAKSTMLKNLTTLNLVHCGIGRRGAGYLANSNTLRKLTTLNLSSNGISDTGVEHLAKSTTLKNLTTLNLSYNYISDIGVDYLAKSDTLKNLTTLDLKNNDEITLGTEEDRQSTDPQRWRELVLSSQAGERKALHRAKVLILGNGEVGKSHLRERLFGHRDATADPKYYDPQLGRTHDIEMCSVVRTAMLKPPTGTSPDTEDAQAVEAVETDVSLSVWDFGGQKELHGAHRFFLSDQRALFIIVLDATKDLHENRLAYWLRYIRYEASEEGEGETTKGPPILVVVTKCDGWYQPDECTIEILLEEDCKKLKPDQLRTMGNFSDQTPIEVVWGVGYHTSEKPSKRHSEALVKVEEKICALIPKIRNISDTVNKGEHGVLKYIEEEFSNRVPYLDITQEIIEQTEEIENREKYNRALLIAHNIGLVHWLGFRKNDQAAREIEQIVFNPDWVRTPVYRVIRAESFSNSGILMADNTIDIMTPHEKDLKNAGILWDTDHVGEDDIDRVRKLMQSCELVFPLFTGGTADGRLFVPDLLKQLDDNDIPDHNEEWDQWVRSFPWLSRGAFARVLGHIRGSLGNKDKVEQISRGLIRVLYATGSEVMVYETQWPTNEDPDATQVTIAVRPASNTTAQSYFSRIAVWISEVLEENTCDGWETQSGAQIKKNQAAAKVVKVEAYGVTISSDFLLSFSKNNSITKIQLGNNIPVRLLFCLIASGGMGISYPEFRNGIVFHGIDSLYINGKTNTSTIPEGLKQDINRIRTTILKKYDVPIQIKNSALGRTRKYVVSSR